MSEDAKRPVEWPVIMAIGLAALVVYVLGVGPAVWLHNKLGPQAAWVSMAIATVYSPLEWFAMQFAPVESFFRWYIEFFQ